MRKKSWTDATAVEKKEMETNFPTLEIEPVDVQVVENDTIIEDESEVLKTLIKLSGIETTVDDFIKEQGYKLCTDNEWKKFFLWGQSICHPVREFLYRYYAWRKAYVKVWDRVLYWNVEIWDYDDYELQTSEWILVMPSVAINGEYVFFPAKALLSSEEAWIYELYKQYGVDVSEKDRLEKLLMETMMKLSALWNDRSIKETSWFMKDIVEYCQNSWMVDRLSIQDWKLVIDFGWRMWKDMSWVQDCILPPCRLMADFVHMSVKWSEQLHPHILESWNLCLGAELTEIVGNCIRNKNLKWIVEALVQFAWCFTSSDCHFADFRSPAWCLSRYTAQYSKPSPFKIADICKEISRREQRWRIGNETWRQALRDMLMNEDVDELKSILRVDELYSAVNYLFQNSSEPTNNNQLDRVSERFHFTS